MCAIAHMWKPEDTSVELDLSFHYVGCRDGTLVIMAARVVTH